MKYLYANFTENAVNYGNWIIDYATRLLLDKYLGAPSGEFDSTTGHIDRTESYDFALIPGCTLLTRNQFLRFQEFKDLNLPIYCLAGNIWAPTRVRGVLMRTRVVHFSKPFEPDLEIARQCSEPVGCRDPYTFDVVRRNGMDAVYMGCPTLMLPDRNVFDDGFVLMSFGRHRLRTQVHHGNRLAARKPVIGICHQIGDYDRIRAAGWRLPLVEYHGDLPMYLSYFERASVVVTGRLHGALPAIAFRKPILYFGTNDSRTTILDDLGVVIHPYQHISQALELAQSSVNRRLIEMYHIAWQSMLETILSRHRITSESP